MKQYKHGMVLGKFYPPHNGHLYLIDEAIKNCHRVTVYLCTQPSEQIDGELRYNWMFELLKDKNVTLVWIKDELPQTPEEHGDKDDFYRIWVNEVQSRQVDLDVIFTSENYGDEFAKYLGIEHELVDLERITHSVSGTDIRTDPFLNWEHIPDSVKPYFKKKIVVLGPESTGKTTLIKRLANHYNGDLVLEYGREYTDDIPASTMCEMDFEDIANIHNKCIQFMMIGGTSPFVFIDTEAITTKLFGEMYLGDDFDSDYIDEIIEEQDFDLVLLCGTDVPWIDDGTRDFPNDRERHLKKIKDELRNHGIRYKNITGTYVERYELSKKLINQIIKK